MCMHMWIFSDAFTRDDFLFIRLITLNFLFSCFVNIFLKDSSSNKLCITQFVIAVFRRSRMNFGQCHFVDFLTALNF